jgi:multisubunit Na+/H+ antiporter MnhF subunit
MATLIFRVLVTIDAFAAIVIGYFFVAGLADGSVSAFNIQLWIGILSVVSVIILAGAMLHRADQTAWANIVLAILALPATLYGVFIILFVLSGASWN